MHFLNFHLFIINMPKQQVHLIKPKMKYILKYTVHKAYRVYTVYIQKYKNNTENRTEDSWDRDELATL